MTAVTPFKIAMVFTADTAGAKAGVTDLTGGIRAVGTEAAKAGTAAQKGAADLDALAAAAARAALAHDDLAAAEKRAAAKPAPATPLLVLANPVSPAPTVAAFRTAETAVDSMRASVAGISATVGQQAQDMLEAAQSAAAYQAALDEIRASYNPIFAASRQYEQQLERIAEAERLGAISAREAAAARAAAAAQLGPASPVPGAPGSAGNPYTANVAAQGFDIGVTAAMGMNPLMIGLQQGTQLAQVAAEMGGGKEAVKGIAAGMMSLISPTTLATIALTTFGAVGIQWLMKLGGETKSLEEAMADLEDSVGRLKDVNANARRGFMDLAGEFGSTTEDAQKLLDVLAEIERRTTGRSAQAAMSSLVNELGGGSMLKLRSESDRFGSLQRLFGEASWLTSGRISESGSPLNRVLVTKIEVTIVNGAVEARVAELEAAQVTTTGAIATQKSETEARFGLNETRIGAEENARAAADKALGNRITTLESSNGTNTAKIQTIEATLVTLDEAAATREEEIGARLGAAEKVRDGVFAQGLKHWPGGNLGTTDDVLTKSKTGDWRTITVPADRYLLIRSGTPLTAFRRSVPMAVAPGDVFDLSMAYARVGNGVQPRMRAIFRDAAGGWIGSPSGMTGTGSGAWRSAYLRGIVAPAGAVDVVFDILSASDGASHAWVTELSARKRQAFEHQIAADVAELTYAFADPEGAIAGVREAIEANWTSLDSRVKSNATAISNRYTKAQTDSAITASIESYDATLTNRLGQKANASTVNALTSRVSEVEGDLASHSDAITQTRAQSTRASASGLLRVSSVASGAGASTRIAIAAEASADTVSQAAGLYIEAGTDGQNGVYVVADTFAVVASRAANAVRTAPFLVRGGRTYMNGAEIADLTVGRLQLGDYAASVFPYSWASGAISADAGKDVVLASLTLTKGRADPMPLFFRVNGSFSSEILLYRGSTLIHTVRMGGWDGENAIATGETVTVVDLWTGTSAVTYQLRGRMYRRVFFGGSENGEWIWQRTSEGYYVNRFLGAFNAFK